MKFFTEEWYHDTLVSQMCFTLRKSMRAATFNEKFFESLYKSEKKKYARSIKFICKISKKPFDLESAEKDFETNYHDNLEFVKSFPYEITSKIADIRVFALGVVEYGIFDEITRYCGQINRKCEKVKRDYDDHVVSFGEEIGWKKIDTLSLLHEAEISEFKLCGDDLVISSLTNSFEMTLYNEKTPLSEKYQNATILAYELDKDEQSSKLTLSLLSETLDGELFSDTLCFDDFEMIETE